jgi:hypothetical protein
MLGGGGGRCRLRPERDAGRLQGRDVEREREAIVLNDVVELAEQGRLLIPSRIARWGEAKARAEGERLRLCHVDRG